MLKLTYILLLSLITPGTVFAEEPSYSKESQTLTYTYTSFENPNTGRNAFFCYKQERSINARGSIEIPDFSTDCNSNIILLTGDQTPSVFYQTRIGMEKVAVDLSAGTNWTPADKTFSITSKSMEKLLADQQKTYFDERKVQYAGKGIVASLDAIENTSYDCHFDEETKHLICQRTETFVFQEKLFPANAQKVYSDAASAGCVTSTKDGYLIFADSHGKLQLPGGKRHLGETAREAAERSAIEETGAHVTAKNVASVETQLLSNDLHYIFECSLKSEQTGFTPKDQYESHEILFFNKETKEDLLQRDWLYENNKKLLLQLSQQYPRSRSNLAKPLWQ